MKEAAALAAVVLAGYLVAGLVGSVEFWTIGDGWQVAVAGRVFELVW